MYTPSPRVYEPPQDPQYPFHDCTIRVNALRPHLGSRKINLSVVFAEQVVVTREVDDQVWQVSFLEYDLGYVDQGSRTGSSPVPIECTPDTLLTMCPE